LCLRTTLSFHLGFGKFDQFGRRQQIPFFMLILSKLTIDKSNDLLPDAKYKKLFHFTSSLENETTKSWVDFNWHTIFQQFKTKDFYRCKNSQNIVGNVLRHTVKWMNDHYNFKNKIESQHKVTSVKQNDKWTSIRYYVVTF